MNKFLISTTDKNYFSINFWKVLILYKYTLNYSKKKQICQDFLKRLCLFFILPLFFKLILMYPINRIIVVNSLFFKPYISFCQRILQVVNIISVVREELW
nr:MAG TPA: hypothetical protein [Caudoviricetes sp.]